MAEQIYYRAAAWFWCKLGNLAYPGLGMRDSWRWHLACELWAKSANAADELLMLENPELRP